MGLVGDEPPDHAPGQKRAECAAVHPLGLRVSRGAGDDDMRCRMNHPVDGEQVRSCVQAQRRRAATEGENQRLATRSPLG